MADEVTVVPAGATPGPDLDTLAIGERLREAREAQHLGLRELARRVSVSPSFVSQIERGLASPSVATLYSIVSELNLSLDELFSGVAAPDATERASSPVLRASDRRIIHLASGVRWERLTPDPEPDVDFLYAVYEVGGASSPDELLIRHTGKEYGIVLEGRLGLTVGPDTWELDPGDSVSFDSTTPHRLWAVGEEAAVVVWFVAGRRDEIAH
ncbi:MAG TPA: cupin domain-containing protein [Solirubrobacteraceae bacterium]|jgi:transcriptional regulator with XRE-family HTH domain|nr:cupin domain-containing protein [Solirubrobacteraceae bacterium]